MYGANMGINRVGMILINNTQFLNSTSYVEGGVFTIFNMQKMIILNSQFIGNTALQKGGVIAQNDGNYL